MNFYKKHIGDYIKDAAHLSLLEHGVYNRLLDVYYTREDGIPKQDAARLIGARTRDEKAALEAVLNEFFQCFDGVWHQDRCDREIAHANDKAERNREIGKKGGRPRKNGNGGEPTNNPNGFHHEPTDNPIQTPDSISQTPEASTEQRDKRAAGDDDPGSRKRGTRIPTPFAVTEEMRMWAGSEFPGVDVKAATAEFEDYWIGVAGAKGVKLDWIATWRNRIRDVAGRTRGARAQAEPNHVTKFDRMMTQLNGGGRG